MGLLRSGAAGCQPTGRGPGDRWARTMALHEEARCATPRTEGQVTEAPWRPPRPSRGDDPWSAGADPARRAEPLASADPAPDDARPTGAARPADRDATGRRWPRLLRGPHRASRGRRLLLAAGATLLATTLVVTAGVVTQPRYPVGRPLGGVVVDELRRLPSPEGWVLTPDRLGVEGVDTACLDYTVIGRVGGGSPDLLVATSTQLTTVLGVCDDRDGLGERVARLDPGTGTVRWSLDSDAVGGGGGALQVWPSTRRGDLLLSTGAFGGFGVSESGFARVDLDTGELLEVQATDAGLRRVVDANDDWVLVRTDPDRRGDRGTSFVDGDSRSRLELFARDDLDVPTWSGSTSDQEDVVLLDDAVLVFARGAAVRVDAASGETSAWGDRWRTPVTPVRRGELLAVDSPGSDGRVDTAELVVYDLDGTELWRRRHDADRTPVLSGGCVVFSGRDALSCVDRLTGDERWSVPRDDDDRGVPIVLEPPVGQSGRDAFVRTFVRAPSGDDDGDRVVAMIDDATGEQLLEAAVPNESTMERASESVGYAFSLLRYANTGDLVGRSVTAFDLSDGRRLWRAEPDELGVDDLQFWGGVLVGIGRDGTVRRFGDPVRLVG